MSCCPNCGSRIPLTLLTVVPAKGVSHGLTERQQQCLLFVKSHIAGRGFPPSYERIRVALGLRSKSGVHRLLNGLAERGHISRLPKKAHSIVLIAESG